MYTQCGHCKAIFRVTMKELTAAQGMLRCGECGSVFDAMQSLSTTLPEDRQFIKNNNQAASGDAVEMTADQVELQSRKKVYLSQAQKLSEQKKASQKPAAIQSKPSVLSNKPNKKPSFAKSDAALKSSIKRRPSHSRKFVMIAIICLSLLLLLQLLYTQKNWLADQPFTAGATRAFCKLVGCDVGQRRDLTQLEMLNRNVYSHPNEQDVLMITATIENQADFSQPYPLLEISFLDGKNDVLALRRFTPEEYLPDTSPQALMDSGKAIDIRVKIADPGKDAVRFQFRFL